MIKKNDIQHKCKPQKIIIQLWTRLEIDLFFKSEHSKYIALIEIVLRYTISAGLWLHIHKYNDTICNILIQGIMNNVNILFLNFWIWNLDEDMCIAEQLIWLSDEVFVM